MTGASVYILDANVFIEASRRYYSFDFAPGFWDGLLHEAQNGRIRSIKGFSKIKGVKEELEDEGDPLANWIRNAFSQWFLPIDEAGIIDAYRSVMEWVDEQAQYIPAAKAEFASGADGWLIASAMARDQVVVTEEVSAPLSKKHVKVPDVCKHFGITTIDTFQMIRRLGLKWST